MPRLMATSMDSLNFAVAPSFTILSASAMAYILSRSTLVRSPWVRLDRLLMSDPLHFDAHAAGTAGYRTHGGFQRGCRQVRRLLLGNRLDLRTRQPANLVGVRLGAAFFDLDRF